MVSANLRPTRFGRWRACDRSPPDSRYPWKQAILHAKTPVNGSGVTNPAVRHSGRRVARGRGGAREAPPTPRLRGERRGGLAGARPPSPRGCSRDLHPLRSARERRGGRGRRSGFARGGSRARLGTGPSSAAPRGPRRAKSSEVVIHRISLGGSSNLPPAISSRNWPNRLTLAPSGGS